MIKTIIFDLDGTLINTAADLTNALNYSLKRGGYAERSRDEVISFVGNGIKNLIERAAPKGISEEAFAGLHSDFIEFYRANSCVESIPYEGIPELLKSLKQKGIKLCVITNKAHFLAENILKTLFGEAFDNIIGASDLYPRKPDPTSTLKTLQLFNTKQEEAVIIGDSSYDIITAKNSGIRSIGVTWGFRSEEDLRENGADYIARSAEEILRIIEEA